jgi:hypothetical protein
MQTKKANATPPKDSRLALQVMNDLTVQIIPNSKHEFLMDTETVAKGYGVSRETIISHKSNHKDELNAHLHWLTPAIENFNSDMQIPHNKVFWTKAGIIRLGFFIKSDRAIAFRNWAEKVILEKITAPKLKSLPPPTPRRHNRLTRERLIDLLAEVAKIENTEIRLSIIKKLGL